MKKSNKIGYLHLSLMILTLLSFSLDILDYKITLISISVLSLVSLFLIKDKVEIKKSYYLPFIFLFTPIFISVIIGNTHGKFIEKDFYLLVATLSIFAIKPLKIQKTTFSYILSFFVLCCFIIFNYDLQLGIIRPKIGISSITYTGIIAAISCIIASFYLFEKNKWTSIFMSIIFLMSYQIILFGQSRGSLLAFIPAILLMVSSLYYKKNKLLTISTISLMVLITINSPIMNRINIAKNELSKSISAIESTSTSTSTSTSIIQEPITNTANKLKNNGSVGVRLGLWMTAIDMGSSSPIVGVGHSNYQAYLLNNPNSKWVGNLNHFHNEYLQMYAYYGLCGVIFLTLFYFYFIKIFYGIRKENIAISFAGISLITSYFISGLTDVPLTTFGAKTVLIICYILLLSIHTKSVEKK